MVLTEIYNLLSKTENAKIISTKEIIGNNAIKKYAEVISIETELSLNTGLKLVLLYLALDEPYEVNLPKVFIDENSYKQIKYIPHVNHDLSICVIDESENINYDISQLPELSLNLISDVKKILRSQNDPAFIKKEFEREFSAYWDINYNETFDPKKIGLCLVDFNHFENLKGIRFLNKYGHYSYLVYNLEKQFLLFENFLKKKNIKYDEISVFTSNYNIVSPPFRITVKESIDKIIEIERFKSKINKIALNNLVVVFKGIHNELFGWNYSLPDKNTNGFRKMSRWQHFNYSISDSQFVKRLSFSDLTPKRLDIRTAGVEIERSLSLVIIGLGSVGSNLLYYLEKFPISKYCLIDPDILKVENVYRNKFGFSDISENKTKISEMDILSKNPFVEVVTNEKDICDVLLDSPKYIEDFDFRFIVLGVTRLEKHILEHLISINSDKPIILLWIEPYVASGQLIYLRSEDLRKGIDLINNYPYHVIESGQNLSRKEGSCQTGYMPYSDMQLSLFLSAINPKLYGILIENNYKGSTIFSWIGDVEEIQNNHIIIKETYKSINKFTLLEHEL